MADFNFSIFIHTPRVDTDSSGLTAVAEDVLRAMGDIDRWQITTDGFWCCLNPHGRVRRAQGWKLHVSATPASAELVLTRSLPVLLESGAAFKFARTTDHVAQLTARHTPQGQVHHRLSTK